MARERVTAIETVRSVSEHGAVSFEGGSGYGGHPSLAVLQPGEQIQLEYLGRAGWGGQIVGARRPDGPWLYRKTDEDLEAERVTTLADIDRRREEQLMKHRGDWAAREALLPEWLRARLATFHERGGARFEFEGWGYELVVCELAALYAADDAWVAAALPMLDGWQRMRLDDPAPVAEIAKREGTSGNQHHVAQALAIAHTRRPDESLAGTVSALAPITGEPFYDGKPTVGGRPEDARMRQEQHAQDAFDRAEAADEADQVRRGGN